MSEKTIEQLAQHLHTAALLQPGMHWLFGTASWGSAPQPAIDTFTALARVAASFCEEQERKYKEEVKAWMNATEPEFEPVVVGPPTNIKPHLRDIQVPGVLPEDPTELEILRLRLLHPELKISLTTEGVAQLGRESKERLLAGVRGILGVLPLRQAPIDQEERKRLIKAIMDSPGYTKVEPVEVREAATVDLHKMSIEEIRQLGRECDDYLLIWHGILTSARARRTPEWIKSAVWRLEGQTEHCCECGGDYPQADLHFGDHVLCPKCRKGAPR